jgi:carboxymethylenebutenolidase
LVIGLIVGYYVGAGEGYKNKMDGDKSNSEMVMEDSATSADGTDVAASEVAYFNGTTGYFAEPRTEGQYPGVVMIHEWWGLNDNIRDMARQLASQGYRVLAVDLFGQVAQTPDEARAQVSALDQEIALQNLQAAAGYLRDNGSDRIASLGWCFGGGQSLQLGLSEEDLDATVIYYGNLVTDTEALAQLDQPVLGIFGDEDASIPVEDVRTFQATLDDLSVPHEIHVYPGVGHAFANPSGMNYAAEETMDAWEKTLAFLSQNLK